MIYTKFYWGDYLRDTNFLSPAQHGYYMLMLADYYSTEKPLTTDRNRLYRRMRIVGEEEKAELEEVISEFWEETEDGLVNARADKEIAEWHDYLKKQQDNGKRGGRPTAKRRKTKRKPTANPPLSDGKATVKPSTSTSTSTSTSEIQEPELQNTSFRKKKYIKKKEDQDGPPPHAPDEERERVLHAFDDLKERLGHD